MNIQHLIEPRLNLVEDRPVCAEDYKHFVKTSSDILRGLDTFSVGTDDILTAIIFVCEQTPFPGSHYADEELVWCSHDLLAASKTIKKLLEENQNVTFTQLVNTHARPVLQLLEPRLREWSKHPAACHAAAVVLEQLGEDSCAELLAQLLPHLLRWSDSWMTRPRLLSARLLNILLDIPEHHFVKFGRDKVVYDALLKHLNSQDTCVLEVSVLPLMKVVKMTTQDQHRRSLSQIDYFTEKLFTSIDLETRADKKKLKYSLLQGTWPVLKEASLRWIPRLASIVASEVELGSQDSKLLLQIWSQECKMHPSATSLEGKVIYPALLKTMWRMCQEDSCKKDIKDISREDVKDNCKEDHKSMSREDITDDLSLNNLVTCLSDQIRSDPSKFLRYTKGMEASTQNQKFLNALETAYAQ